MKRDHTHIHSIIRPLLCLAILNPSHCRCASDRSTNGHKPADPSISKSKLIPPSGAPSKDGSDTVDNEAVTSNSSLNPDEETLLQLAEELKSIAANTQWHPLQRLAKCLLLIEDFTNALGLKEGAIVKTYGKELKSAIQAIEKIEDQLKSIDIQIKNSQSVVERARNTVDRTTIKHRPVNSIMNVIIELEQFAHNLKTYLSSSLESIFDDIIAKDGSTVTHQIPDNKLDEKQEKLNEFNSGISASRIQLEQIQKGFDTHLDNSSLNGLFTAEQLASIQPQHAVLFAELKKLIQELSGLETLATTDYKLNLKLKALPTDILQYIQTIQDYKISTEQYQASQDQLITGVQGSITYRLHTLKELPQFQQSLQEIQSAAEKISKERIQIKQEENRVYSDLMQADQKNNKVVQATQGATESKKKIIKDLVKNIEENFLIVQNFINLLGEKKKFPPETQAALKHIETLYNQTAEMLQKGQIQSIEKNTTPLLEAMEKALRLAAKTKSDAKPIN